MVEQWARLFAVGFQSIHIAISFLFCGLALIGMIINMLFSPNHTFSYSKFLGRFVSALFCVLILAPIIGANILPGFAAGGATAIIVLTMLREFSVAIAFTGLDMTPLTVCIDVAINIITRQRSNK